VVGDEPAALVQAAGLPTVPYARVSVVDTVGIASVDPSQTRTVGGAVLVKPGAQPTSFALKVKHSQRCAGCYDGCGFQGCVFGQREFFTPVVFGRGSCEFKLFHRCRQEWRRACRVDVFTCDNCQGSIQETWYREQWQCEGGC
jgi:hypothetical protein